jgi:hypothetical protein
VRENRMHGSTGRGWKRKLKPPRQPFTLLQFLRRFGGLTCSVGLFDVNNVGKIAACIDEMSSCDELRCWLCHVAVGKFM